MHIIESLAVIEGSNAAHIQEIAMSDATPTDHTLETNAATDQVLPDSLDALLALGHRYLDDRHYVEAQGVFSQALDLAPANAEARHNLGYAFECQGAIDDAMAAYEAVRQGPTPLPQSSFNLGVLLSRSGRNDEARQAFQEALERDPSLPRDLDQSGRAARPGRTARGGAPLLRTGARDRPSCHSAHVKLANLLARDSRWEEALGCYARLAEEGWNPAEVQYRRGLTLAARGDEDEAIKAYERALDAIPTMSGSRRNWRCCMPNMNALIRPRDAAARRGIGARRCPGALQFREYACAPGH